MARGPFVILGNIALALAVAGPVLAHLEMVEPMQGFVMLLAALFFALLSAVFGVIRLVRGPAGIRGAVLAGMAPAIGVLVVVGLAASPVSGVPRINDITTDTTDPPGFVHAPTLPANQGRDMAYPGEAFARQQREGYGEIAPLALARPLDEVFELARAVAADMPGWEITRADASTAVIEAVDTSWLFRFRDDIVIAVRPGDDGTSLVHMRSKSRDGKSDLGANAARIRTYQEALAARAGSAGT